MEQIVISEEAEKERSNSIWGSINQSRSRMKDLVYNRSEKLEIINKEMNEIDEPIKSFILKLNEMEGMMTIGCCSGHFSTNYWIKHPLFDTKFDHYFEGHSLFDRTTKIVYQDPYISLLRTPEAEKLIPLFEKDGFKTFKYENDILFQKFSAKTNWKKLLKKLEEGIQTKNEKIVQKHWTLDLCA